MSSIKRGKEIDLRSWKELLPDPIPDKPDGYSTAEEIAKKLKTPIQNTHYLLKKLRDEGKIKFMKAKSHRGKTVFVYKD